MRRATLIAAAAAVALAGCGGGGGGSDKDQIATTINTYYSAFANQDAATACAQLSRQTRDRFQKATHADCAKTLADAAQRPDVKKYLTQIGKAKIKSVNVQGDSATATVQLIGQTTSVPLKKEGGAWKIQTALGG